MNKKCTLHAELYGISAMLCVLSSEFLEDNVTGTPDTIGTTLYATACYIERIAKDLYAVGDDEIENARADQPRESSSTETAAESKELCAAIIKELEGAAHADLEFCFYYLKARRGAQL